MIEVTANEIKTKGISALNEIARNGEDAIITVKGKRKFVVIPVEKYNRFRESELEQAIEDVKSDIAAGRYYSGVKKHLKKVSNV